jgi:transcription termination factor Rho
VLKERGDPVATQTIIHVADLDGKTKDELIILASDLGLENGTALTSLRREDVLLKVMQSCSDHHGLMAGGVLEIMNEGYGFLRQNIIRPGSGDVYISQSQIRRFSLRTGDAVSGLVRPPKEGERYYGLVKVESVNDLDPDNSRSRVSFDNLTPIFPDQQIKLELSPDNLTTRMIDLFSPIGLGQRGLIVSPPKAGKTTVLKHIARGATVSCPDAHLMVALIGERPEEVTDMRRSIRGEVFGSTFDENAESQCRVGELALERAKRLVEAGRDVIILLDSITRFTRAYNLAAPTTGRTLSGGIDPGALYPAKRFFGAARNVEEGGSLTIIANCLVDTGSRMDEVIYEEFKGTGNMELHLDRKLADRRFFPAVDIVRSGTRREELLYDETTMKQIWLLRRMISLISNDGSTSATERVLERLSKYQNNEEFLSNLNKET